MEDEDNRYDNIPDECYCKECGMLLRDESYTDEGTGHNTVPETSCTCII